MLLFIVFLPFLLFIVISAFGRFLGQKGVSIMSPILMGINSILAFISFYKVGILGETTYITLGTWIDCGLFVVNWGFMFDSLTVSMFILVVPVSFLVQLYSVYYMETDAHFVRFMSYLALFTFFMLILVSADNFIQLFLG